MPGKQGDNGARDDANGKADASQGRLTAHDEEQLSAYLDGELDAAERAALDGRLAEDATLQRALGELRQTRALLRALPTPAAPRSFALPEVGELTTDRPQQRARRDDDDAHMTGPLRTMPRMQAHRRDTSAPRISARAATRSARVAQWMGTLVAVLGLALLLGATLPAHAPSIGSAGASTAASERHSPAVAASMTPGGAVAGPGNPTSTQTATVGANTTQGSATTATAPTARSPEATTTTTASAPGGGESVPPPLEQTWLSALGILLLVGGVILFAYGRFARPRR